MQEPDEILKYRQKFDEFYNKNLKHLFEKLEKSRKKYLKMFVISAFFIFGLLPATILWQLENIKKLLTTHVKNFDVDIAMLSYLLLAGVVAIPISLYKMKNKKIIMPEFIKFFEGFNYTHNKELPDQLVKNSYIFFDYDDKMGDDYFEGVYKDVTVRISEERLEQHYKNSKGEKSTKTIFEGVFVCLSMNKSFEGKTVGKKDKGFLNKLNGITGHENVKLEDPIFEKEWEIYSDCQVEARYLLTTAFMERLLKVKELYKSNRLQFAFFDNILFIAIDMKGDLFETSSLFKSCFDKKHINQTLEQFLSVLAIVDILKLNQRIGM